MVHLKNETDSSEDSCAGSTSHGRFLCVEACLGMMLSDTGGTGCGECLLSSEGRPGPGADDQTALRESESGESRGCDIYHPRRNSE